MIDNLYHNRRSTDPKSHWDWLHQLFKGLAVFLGAITVTGVLCFGAGYFVGKYERQVLEAAVKAAKAGEALTCGSCRLEKKK